MRAAALICLLAASGCAGDEGRDGMQTVRDGLFYDGLAAFHEGYYTEAAARWERAAHFGDGDAARNLGHLYRQGLGVEKDAAIAVAWYQVAVDAGNSTAKYNLGMAYLKGGENLKPDPALARHWLSKAAEAGIKPAKAELDRLAAAPPAPAPEPPPPAPVAAAPAYVEPPPAPVRVQIGSYRSKADAEKDWQRLKRPGLAPEIVTVHMGERGVWNRLLAVGAADVVEAYCRDAAKRKIGCWPGNPK